MKKGKGSNPSFSANISLDNQAFESEGVAEEISSDIFRDIKCKFETSRKSMHRFVPARLIIPDKQSKDQRYYIRYQVFSEPDQKVRPFKVYLIDKYRQHPQFDELARLICKKINQLLEAGAVYNPNNVGIDPPQKRVNVFGPDVSTAMALVLNQKSVFKENTFLSYKKVIKAMDEYLAMKKKSLIRLREFDDDMCREYSVYMRRSKKLSARTHNNHINALKTIWNDLIEMDQITKNPWLNVKKPKAEKGRNVAFTPQQQRELIEFMEKNEPRILFLCKFMYYTGCRSVEMANIKIKDIYAKESDKIFLHQKWSKSSQMRHIVVHPKLAHEFEKLQIKKHPAEHYLFGAGLVPRTKPKSGRYIAHLFRKKVLTPLNYSKDYTLYSWRHTFAVMGHMAGMTIAEIGMQLGHSDTNSTNTYLKSLGLFSNNAVKDKLPEL